MSVLVASAPPLREEGLAEWLIRISGINCYESADWILDLAGVNVRSKGLAEELAGRLSRVTGVGRAEISGMLNASALSSFRSLPSHLTGGAVIAGNCGRICPECVRERDAALAAWRLPYWVACPIHRCGMVEGCPHCGEAIDMRRPAPNRCRRCRGALNAAPTASADEAICHVVAMMASFAGWNGLAETSPAHESLGRPDAATVAKILPILGIGPSSATPIVSNLRRAKQVVGTFARTTADWPASFHRFLDRFTEASSLDDRQDLIDIYGRVYLYCTHDSFERRSGTDAPTRAILRQELLAHISANRIDESGSGKRRAVQGARITPRDLDITEAMSVTGLSRMVLYRYVEQGTIVAKPSRKGTTLFISAEEIAKLAPRRELSQTAQAAMALFGVPPDQAEKLRSTYSMSHPEVAACLGVTTQHTVELASLGRLDLDLGLGRPRVATASVIDLLEALATRINQDQGTKGRTEHLTTIRQARKMRFGPSNLIAAMTRGELTPFGPFRRGMGVLDLQFDPAELDVLRTLAWEKDGMIATRQAAAIIGGHKADVRRLAAEGLLTRIPPAGRETVALLHRREVEEFAATYATTSRLAKRISKSTNHVNARLRDLKIRPALPHSKDCSTIWRLSDLPPEFSR